MIQSIEFVSFIDLIFLAMHYKASILNPDDYNIRISIPIAILCMDAGGNKKIKWEHKLV